MGSSHMGQGRVSARRADHTSVVWVEMKGAARGQHVCERGRETLQRAGWEVLLRGVA
jgi:hypothetical protein